WRFGFALINAGNAKQAVDILQAYMRLDPFYAPLTSGILGFAHYMLKQYPQALPAIRDFVSRAPRLLAGRVLLAATYAPMGRTEEARAEAAEVMRLQPNYTIGGIARRIVAFKEAKDGNHYFGGLREAGLPE